MLRVLWRCTLVRQQEGPCVGLCCDSMGGTRAVVTRELAVPLIDETVGSERLDAAALPPGEDEETLAEIAPVVGTQPPLPSAAQSALPQRTQQDSPTRPDLNWTSPDGHLNEVAPGRVLTVPPPAHGSPE